MAKAKTTTQISAERLRELLHYDEVSGEFTRLTDNKRGQHIGAVAGSRHADGYIYIYVDGRTYAAHRLAWLYVHGEWPTEDIDHIHGIAAGNGIDNLRAVSETLNMQNERRARKNNTSGFLGVSWREERQRWVAQIRVHGKQKRVGSFFSREDAYAAYVIAKRKHHPGFVL